MNKCKILGVMFMIAISLCACGSSQDSDLTITTESVTTSNMETSQFETTESEITTEAVEVASLDIDDYINGDYFDVEGYLVSNGFNVFFEPAELKHGNSELAFFYNDNTYYIFSGIGYDDEPNKSNIYSVDRNNAPSIKYQCTTPSDLEHLLQTPFEGFYMFSDKLYVLEYLVDNKDNFTEGTCPFAGSGIEHTKTEHASPVEHND